MSFSILMQFEKAPLFQHCKKEKLNLKGSTYYEWNNEKKPNNFKMKTRCTRFKIMSQNELLWNIIHARITSCKTYVVFICWQLPRKFEECDYIYWEQFKRLSTLLVSCCIFLLWFTFSSLMRSCSECSGVGSQWVTWLANSSAESTLGDFRTIGDKETWVSLWSCQMTGRTGWCH